MTTPAAGKLALYHSCEQSGMAVKLDTGSVYKLPMAVADITAKFTGSGDYLKSDGTRGTPSGGGGAPAYKPSDQAWNAFGAAMTATTSAEGTLWFSYGAGGGTPFHGREFSVSAAADFTKVFRIHPFFYADLSTAQTIGAYFGDGTKAATCGIEAGAGNGGQMIFHGHKWTDASTQGASLMTGVYTPMAGFAAQYFRLSWTAATTTLACAWSPDGLTWVTQWTEATPYLTPTKAGFYLTHQAWQSVMVQGAVTEVRP